MKETNLRYIGNQDPNDYSTEPSVGGDVLKLKAGATLNVGDLVQMSAAFTVIKDTANLGRVIGVVVGGDSLPDKELFTNGSATISTLLDGPVVAATINQSVTVLVRGVAYVKSDGVIAVGAQIEQSAAEAGSVTTITTGPAVGTLIDSATTGDNQWRKAYINIT